MCPNGAAKPPGGRSRPPRAGGRLLLVTVRWPYLDAAGASKGSEVSRYVVWLDRDGEPRIRVGMPWS